eukprot:364822-Chlamydomonas_euryale.AAC.13
MLDVHTGLALALASTRGSLKAQRQCQCRSGSHSRSRRERPGSWHASERQCRRQTQGGDAARVYACKPAPRRLKRSSLGSAGLPTTSEAG